MKKISPIASEAFDKVERFLISKNWSLSKTTDKSNFYTPPTSLGFGENFSILIPKDRHIKSSSDLLISIAQTLSDIYELNVTDILDFVESNESWLIKSRLIDRSIGQGSIPLTKLDRYLKGITKSLYEVAKYQTDEAEKKTVRFANKFIESCKFLPTESGSFVASIEIPSIPISPKGLFGDEGINSRQIASSWFNAISFINDRILQSNENINEALVYDALEKLNLPSAEALAEMIQETQISNFEFQLITDLGALKTASGEVDDDSKQRLSSFIKLYREKLLTEDEASFSGAIIDLHSSNPSGNSNRIVIKCNVFGDPTQVVATLNYSDYQKALSAHGNGKLVFIVGKALRKKAYIKLTKITSFGIV